MIKQNQSLINKHQMIRLLEGLLLAAVLSIAALRLSFIELSQNMMPNAMLWSTPRGMSLILSAVLFIAAAAGLFIRLLSKSAGHQNAFALIGFVLFAAGAAAACFFASDKRAACTQAFTLSVPIFAALIVSRWLDSPRRIDAAVWMILSMGCAAVYVSAEQFMESNQQVVDDYYSNPEAQLQKLGIEPGTLGQFQYEHRLKSRDIRGFLMTSNSTGTFLLAGIFITLGLVIDTRRNRVNETGFLAGMVVQLLILLVLCAGLLLGKSRGAAGSAIMGFILFGFLISCRRWIWKNRGVLLLSAALVFILVCAGIVAYGNKHGRLPGPNAMYVRWQYWVGAAKMAADHPLFGVGGDNFVNLYPLYKIPAAPETVRDPHNVILSLLCQFGPAGLIGFAIVVFAAIWQGLKNIAVQDGVLSLHCDKQSSTLQPESKKDYFMAAGVLGGVLISLLFLRPIFSEGGILGETTFIQQSVFVVLYLVPAFFFCLPYGLLWTTSSNKGTKQQRDGLKAGLLCGIAAISFHNLIDFAIFEPGVWTCFWLLTALIFAMDMSACEKSAAQKPVFVSLQIPVLLGAGCAAIYFLVWIPVLAGRQYQMALRDFDKAESWFVQAAKTDTLDPEPYLYAAKAEMLQYRTMRIQKPELLDRAKTFFEQAQSRDPINYNYPDLLSRLFAFQAENNAFDHQRLLEAAYQAGLKAQKLYPGSDRIAYELGILAEQLGQKQKALGHFCLAVEIEDQYRKQFARMYPDYPLCSRLGQQRYDYAMKFIKSPD